MVYYKRKDVVKAQSGTRFDIYDYYKQNKGANLDNIIRLIGSMGFHESRGRRTQIQNLVGGGAGAGTGFLQFETERAGGSNSAKTAYNQYQNLLNKQGADAPEWFKKFGEYAKRTGSYDYSVLGKPEQAQLAMASYSWGKPEGYLRDFIAGKIDAGTFWSKAHKRSGATQEEINNVNNYYKDLSTEDINNIVYKDDWTNPKNTLDNSNRSPGATDNYITSGNRMNYRCTDGKCNSSPLYYTKNQGDTEKTLWQGGKDQPSREFAEELSRTGNVYNYTPIQKNEQIDKRRRGGILYNK